MAVKVNPTAENSGSGSSKLYTGVVAFKVTHVNPTQDQLKEIGYKAEKEPSYKSTDGKQRIVFVVEGTLPGGTPLKFQMPAFFIDPNKIMTEVWIDKFGAYGKDRTRLDQASLRNPFDGECDLINFIREWANAKKGEEVSLDTIDKIAKLGDVYELRELVKALDMGFVKLFLTVSQDGKYQRVYMRKFLRAFSTDYSWLHKDLVRNEQYIKDHIGPVDLKLYNPEDFKVREWKGDTAMIAKGVAVSSNGHHSANGSASTSAPADTADADDETPF